MWYGDNDDHWCSIPSSLLISRDSSYHEGGGDEWCALKFQPVLPHAWKCSRYSMRLLNELHSGHMKWECAVFTVFGYLQESEISCSFDAHEQEMHLYFRVQRPLPVVLLLKYPLAFTPRRLTRPVTNCEHVRLLDHERRGPNTNL